MWLAKIKKKKLQYIFLSIIIILTVALVSTCTVFTVVSNTFSNNYYKGDETPDIMVVTASSSVKEKVVDWYKAQGDSVRNLNEYDLYSVSSNLKVNDNLLEISMGYAVSTNSVDELNWKLEVVEGDTKVKAPGKGEIWIPSILAETEELKLGDKITIKSDEKNNEFKISGIVNDSNLPSSIIGILYIYMNEEDKETIKDFPKANLIILNTDGESAKFKKELLTYINESISGVIFDKSSLIMGAAITPTIIGGMGILACTMIIIIVLIVLRHTLWNNILKEYKSIGIYKSMGFTSKEIQGIYLKAYGLVVIISSFLGCLISIPISTYICRIIFKYLGKYSFDFNSFLILIGIFIFFNFIILGGIKLTLMRINKIKPVEAINIGLKSSKEKFKKSIIKDNSSSIAMAINDIFKYKKQNLVMLMIFILVFYILISFTNIYNSADKIDDNFSNWFGTPSSDMVITASMTEKNSVMGIKEYLKTSDLIENQNSWDYYSNRLVSIDNRKYEVDTSTFMVSIFDYYNEEDFNIEKGRNPREKNEVSLNNVILEKNNLEVGDYIELLIKGEKEKFLITGCYASMMGNSQNIRILTKCINEESSGNVLFVKLKDKKNFESIRTDILNKFDGVSVDKVAPILEDAVSQVKDIMIPVVMLLLIGVGAFSLTIVISMVVSNNLDNRKNFGIMKSLGFSNIYITKRILTRIMILALLGNIVGLILNLMGSRELFKGAVQGIDGYMFTLTGTVLASLILLTLTMLSVIISCRSIKNISTVELIVE